MIFQLSEEKLEIIQNCLDSTPTATEEQMTEIEKVVRAYADNFAKIDEAEYYPTDNKKLNTILSESLGVNLKDPITIHRMTYYEGGMVPEHKDMNSLHTYVIMLEDDFEGGEFYLRGEQLDFNKKGQVAYYMGMDAPHSVSEITKGIRKVLVVWYGMETTLV